MGTERTSTGFRKGVMALAQTSFPRLRFLSRREAGFVLFQTMCLLSNLLNPLLWPLFLCSLSTYLIFSFLLLFPSSIPSSLFLIAFLSLAMHSPLFPHDFSVRLCRPILVNTHDELAIICSRSVVRRVLRPIQTVAFSYVSLRCASLRRVMSVGYHGAQTTQYTR